MLYIDPTRTASRSLRIALSRHGGTGKHHMLSNSHTENHPAISPLQIANHDLRIDLKEYFVFGFVRNPFDRIYSLYRRKRDYRNKYRNMSFNELISQLGQEWNSLGYIKKGSFTPQYYWFLNNHKIDANFIGRLESFQDDLSRLKQFKEMSFFDDEVGTPDPDPAITNSSYPAPFRVEERIKNREYREVYDKKMIEIMENVYRDDLEYFGYDF